MLSHLNRCVLHSIVNAHTQSITTEDLKSTSDNAEDLTSLLLHDKSGITLSFGLIDLDDGTTPPKVKMVIRERLDSGVVKLVWSGDLSSSSSGNAFLFVSSLTCSLRDANLDIVHLRSELEKAKDDMIGWKDTATKLDDRWQMEKDDLTERFLVLYNRVKKDLRSVRKELTEEKKKKEIRVRPMVESALAPAEKLAPQNNDDQEEIIWDADEVELLAAGPKVVGARGKKQQQPVVSGGAEKTAKHKKRTRVGEASKAKKAARRSDKDSLSRKLSLGQPSDEDDDDDGDSEREASQARANPISGATEMWGPEGIFADSQEDEDDFETYRQKRLARKALKESSTATAVAVCNGGAKRTRSGGMSNEGATESLATDRDGGSTTGEDGKKAQANSKPSVSRKRPLFAPESDSDSSF